MASEPFVEADLRVGQVVVVDQHEVGHRPPGEIGDRGARAVDVELDPLPAREPFAVVVVEADGDAVRAQHVVLGRRASARSANDVKYGASPGRAGAVSNEPPAAC